MLALLLAVVALSAMVGLRRAIETRALRRERERLRRSIATRERDLGIGLSLAAQLRDGSDEALIASLPSPTPLGLHIDCLLRMRVITFAEWLVLADEHNPLVFTEEARFDPPADEDREDVYTRRARGVV